MKNLIMGVAKGYGWDILEPFVTSAVKNCPNAEIVLFVDDISEFTRERLQCCEKVICVDIPAYYKNVLIIHSRWKICADFLEQFGANYAQVLISDTRDVIFQGDIFKSFENYPNYFGYATEKLSIGEDKICNYVWIESCFGKATADKLSDKKIICCGTVIGTVNKMKTFCRIMWENLKAEMIWGHEQAVMNHLVYENLLPIENLLEIDIDGEIFTMAYAENFSIRGDKIFCGNGKCPAVVHLYDRFNETVNLVDKVYHDKNFQVDESFSDMRSVTEQATCLLFAERIGDAAKFFMKKFLVTEDFSDCVGALLRFWETVMKSPLSPASELIELSAQSALKSIKEISGLPLNKVCTLLNRAQESRHPIDPELKNNIATYLLKLAESKFIKGEHTQYLSCLELIILIEGGHVEWLRN